MTENIFPPERKSFFFFWALRYLRAVTRPPPTLVPPLGVTRTFRPFLFHSSVRIMISLENYDHPSTHGLRGGVRETQQISKKWKKKWKRKGGGSCDVFDANARYGFSLFANGQHHPIFSPLYENARECSWPPPSFARACFCTKRSKRSKKER